MQLSIHRRTALKHVQLTLCWAVIDDYSPLMSGLGQFNHRCYHLHSALHGGPFQSIKGEKLTHTDSKEMSRNDCFHKQRNCLAIVIQSPSCVWPSVTPWTVAHQASRSLTISQSLPKFMSIESVIPSNHLILCHPLLLLPSIFPSIRDFSNESTLRIRWPTYWSFSFSLSPSNEYSGLIAFRMDWLALFAV